ncbi:tyrosine protein kinase [Bifidobacterium breve]|uniref:Uncharacterized protein n=2 Tax=Bifidobacterium breve TaxID=1685 RepID=D4BQA3_BIFBR|nr:tyrosine protein kinase [Bifidobacterium breve]EFE88398.1 hypothetical protein BIFBRE_04272 [Bifidobacterium breve DSM 20213 = JCM 1192]EHS85740.1 Class II receptor tyrosine kinase [Bifidobacterium breve CECT 7263]AYZ89680.1 tyrosine protein kinase [Bifidobacterium breve]KAB1933895.1 tyrosine protein kinase [Bifidobacterium breve]
MRRQALSRFGAFLLSITRDTPSCNCNSIPIILCAISGAKPRLNPRATPLSNQNGTALRFNRRNTPLSTSQRRKTTS